MRTYARLGRAQYSSVVNQALRTDASSIQSANLEKYGREMFISQIDQVIKSVLAVDSPPTDDEITNMHVVDAWLVDDEA